MMLKSPDGTRAMGPDLTLGVRVFQDDEEESEVVIRILLVRTLCRCCSSRSCSRQTPRR